MSTTPTDTSASPEAPQSSSPSAPPSSPPSAPNDTLYLVDGSGFIFRAYHALPKLTTKAGLPTGAVYGFAQMIIKLEQEHRPTHLAVVLDAGGAGFRDELFAEYKANRSEAPGDLLPQFKLVRDVVGVFNLPCIERTGFEADDIIATLARKAVAAGQRVVIVSSDKDMMQLVGDDIRMVRAVAAGPARSNMEDKPIGRAEVIERYGVPPEQLGDVLALMGDSVDNVPGVPGVGEKTATALIRHFGSLSNMLDHLDEVPKVPGLRGAAKIQEALRVNADKARLSRRLVALDENVPLDGLELDSLKRREPDMVALEELFTRLEFGRLIERLRPIGAGSAKTEGGTIIAESGAIAGAITGSTAPVAEAPQLVLSTEVVRVITSGDALAGLMAELRAAGEIGVTFECTGTGPFAPLVGVAFAANGVAPAYVPLGHRYLGAPVQLKIEEARAELSVLLADKAVHKHIHGAKDALLACTQARLQLDGITGDPDLAGYLIDPSRADDKLRSKPLAPLAARFGAHIEERSDLLGKGKKSEVYEGIEVERAALYAGRRAEATLGVSRLLRPDLERRGMAHLLDTIELPLARVLAEIEVHGIRVDTAHLSVIGADMARRMDAIEHEVQALAGYEVNLGSPKQLQELLFERLALPAAKKTKTGYSTDAEVLEELAELHPIAAKILEHRQLSKLKGTYVDALPSLVNSRTGRIHTSFHQTVAGTGRLSSSDPNLQNIPIRSDVGRLIRRAFIADPGNQLIAADYSQIELRVLAHLSDDEVLLDAFTHGEDVHDRTAREMFSVGKEAVTPEMRRVAKAINYGLVYGQTDYGLARAVGIPRDEAKKYIEGYFKRYTGVAKFMDRLISDAHKAGGSITLFQRFRPLPDLDAKNRNARNYAERMARNTPIQGTAADLLKLAMIAVQDRLQKEAPAARMLLTVHDELVLETAESDAPRVGTLVKEVMENVHTLKVPLVVEVGTGGNWADC